MNKKEMIETLINNRVWDGSKDAKFLMRAYSLQEVKDAYDMLSEAEDEYYSSR